MKFLHPTLYSYQYGIMLAVFVSFITVAAAQRCSLTVPAAPLTASGLATPYSLAGCTVTNAANTVFVEALILNPTTGVIQSYYPLVVNTAPAFTTPKPAVANVPVVVNVVNGAGVAAAVTVLTNANPGQQFIAPVAPTLAANSVVGIWFGGSNSATTLVGTGTSLTAGLCVNGATATDIFGVFAYCNAPAFFAAANTAIAARLLKVPALGTSFKGVPCPTVRSFSIVSSAQSSGTVGSYLIAQTFQVAQNTIVNQNAVNGASTVLSIVTDVGDNAISKAVNAAISCPSWLIPNALDATILGPTLATNELLAAAYETNPALVPSADPQTLLAGAPNLSKLNSYRAGVNQPAVSVLPDTGAYCNRLSTDAAPFLSLHSDALQAAGTPNVKVGNNLLNFMANRFVSTWNTLGCTALTGQPSPITVTTNAAGAAQSSNIAMATQLPGQTASTAAGLNAPVATTTVIIAAAVAVVVLGIMAYVAVFVIAPRFANTKTSGGSSVAASNISKPYNPVAKPFTARYQMSQRSAPPSPPPPRRYVTNKGTIV